jgi:ubiquitin carboxyl-terminal hydrolase 7
METDGGREDDERQQQGAQPLVIPPESVVKSEEGDSGQAEQMEIENKADALEGSYTWKIEGFGSLSDKKRYSDTFEIGGYKWRLLVFPRGNGCDHVSLYLDVPDAEALPYNWGRSASFTLVVPNAFDPDRSHRKEATHLFNAKESDWGFTQFMSLEDLYSSQKGFLVDETLTVEAHVKVKTDIDSFYSSYDSRKETGHVGLKNQGATCYMNSLLQTLFHIPYFRKAVYHMPTSVDDYDQKCLPLALQSLFYKVQFNPHAVATKDLTRSFGWDSMDAFTQHDVQELNRVLCEKLEEKMKGTRVENTIQHLFEGHVVNYIECINVDYKSTRKECYMDLQLDVKGCKNVYDSFEKYVEVETLEGDNKYRAEGHGLQDAKKGVLFKDFPPVLQLQLKRFEYDFQNDIMVKINDRYEFPESLDLDRDNFKYMTKDSDKSMKNQYTLYSVLVHNGGVHGGHYYAFIRPDGKQWLKFDDEKVTKVDQNAALEEQYGADADSKNPGFGNNMPPKVARCSNAYMLVYIRDSDRDHILCDVTKDDIAQHLRDRLDAEQEDKERRKKEKQEAHLYTHIKIATDKDLGAQIGQQLHFDLVDFENPDILKLRVQKQAPFSEVKSQVEAQLGVPVDQQRFWSWAHRENRTYRPSKAFSTADDDTRLQDLSSENNQHTKNTMNLFLETPTSEKMLPQLQERDILLFFKLYDVETQKLTYVGREFVSQNSKVRDLCPKMCQLAGFSLDEDLHVYEEVKNEPTVMCEALERHQTLAKCELTHGDIVCFQKAVGTTDLPYQLIPDYLNYIKNRQVVRFTKIDKLEDVIDIELSKLNTYNEVTEALAAKIDLDDPARVRLTAHNCYTNAPRPQSMKYQGVEKLSDMLVHYNQVTDTLYYEILDIPLFELERLKSLKIAFHDEKAEETFTYTLRLPKDSKVEEVLQELRRRIPNCGSEQLRLMEVFYHKIYKTYDENDKIESINDQYWTLRAEAISEEERNLSEKDKLVHVYHFTTKDNGHTSPMTNFGNPFFFVLHEGETLRKVKSRIQAKLNIPDEEFQKWKVAFCSMSRPEYLEDDDIVISRFMRRDSYGPWEHYLGLEHEDKNPKARNQNSNRYNYDKPIKIYS